MPKKTVGWELPDEPEGQEWELDYMRTQAPRATGSPYYLEARWVLCPTDRSKVCGKAVFRQESHKKRLRIWPSTRSTYRAGPSRLTLSCNLTREHEGVCRTVQEASRG